MIHGILVHEPNDDVGVAVSDLTAGTEVGAITLEGEPVCTVQIVENILLGHKVALHDLPAEKHVQEYGRTIGRLTQAAPAGSHVHVHNLKGLRWSGRPLLADQ